MTIYIVQYTDGDFSAAFLDKNKAVNYVNSENENWEYDMLKDPFEYELIMDEDDHINAINNIVLGHCIDCNCELTKENVVYSCGEPFYCHDCAPDKD